MGRWFPLIACILLLALGAYAASPHPPAKQSAGDSDFDYLDLMGYACIAVAFAALVVISIADGRPFSAYDPNALPPPRRRKRNRDPKRRPARSQPLS